MNEKIKKYSETIAPIIVFIQENLNKSLEKKILIRINDIKREMGLPFEDMPDMGIYWALKYTIFNQGIIVEFGRNIEYRPLLIFRPKSEFDKLPPKISEIQEEIDFYPYQQ